MLKIKDKYFNKKLIKYITKCYWQHLHNKYCIDVYFTDDTNITISFESEQERDETFDKIMENEE